MWHDSDAAAVPLTRVATRTGHAAHAPTWVIILGIGLGVLLVLWLGLVLVRDWRRPGRGQSPPVRPPACRRGAPSRRIRSASSGPRIPHRKALPARPTEYGG